MDSMISFSRPALLIFTLLILSFAENARATRLSFRGDLNIPTGTKFENTDFGGLSGLAYDPVTDVLLALSDDKGDQQPARFYRTRVRIGSGYFHFDPLSYTTLRKKNGTVFPKGTIDPEGIAALGDRRIFVSSEGNGRAVPRVPPGIFEVDGNGQVLRSLALPRKYLPETIGKQTRGTVDNCAFESVTLSPNLDSLFTATECPLVQDDTPASFEKGGLSRILQFHLEGDHRVPSAEYSYFVEPNDRPRGANVDYGNGISEMIALNSRELLVLERGTAGTPDGAIGRIRIFKATLGGGATNVANLESIRGRRVRPVKKELVLDLNAVLPELNPKWRSLDNIEGMTFGPTLPNGHRTLILVSDNNFSPYQRTQLLAFEIVNE
jgi:hypothetical protein